jgi:DNA-binding transcriptional LysR family regulator
MTTIHEQWLALTRQNTHTHMKSLKGIASFIAVASTGSFAAAARLQGVSAVAVSKNVATLERQLSVRLFQRTTRQLSLTPEGNQFYEQCQGPLRALEAAQANLETSAKGVSGLVRVTCASPFGMGFLVPLLPAFHALHPNIQLELHLDDAVNDMVGDGYDIGIRIGELRDSSLIARPIGFMPFALCASPAYFAAHPAPQVLADLPAHNCMRLRRKGSSEPMPWFLKGLDMAANKQCTGNFLANDFAVLMQAAKQGQGLICAPLPQLMPALRSGELQVTLADCVEAKFQVYLHYPNRHNMPTRIRTLVDFLMVNLGSEPNLQTPPQVLLAELVSPLAK